ncbi:hypothetical protein HK100_001620 [Physocladia obscura]|uniref:Uncharacterized protein n=1 Tax=Physocladia obscura TaxID=109957 RepID=A0AAD5SZ30_9FUNG|nr:hypothetical protein HK100_001620 [Physocladia obscura]
MSATQGNSSGNSIGQTQARQPNETQGWKQPIGAGLSTGLVDDLNGFGVGSSLGMLFDQEQQHQQSDLSVDADFDAEAQRLVAQLTPAQRVALAAAALGGTSNNNANNSITNNSTIDYSLNYSQNNKFNSNQSIPAADQQLQLQLLAFQYQQQQELMAQQIQMLQMQVTAAQIAGSPLSSPVDPFLPMFQQEHHQQFLQEQLQLQQQLHQQQRQQQQQQQDIHPLLREFSLSTSPPESTMGMSNQFVDPFLDPLPLTRFDSALQSTSTSGATEKKQKPRGMGSLFRAFSGSASPPRNNNTEQQSFPISNTKWLAVGRKSSPPKASSNYSKNDSGNEEDDESENDRMDLGKLLSAKSAKSSKLKSLRARSAEKLEANIGSQDTHIIQHDSDEGGGSDVSANSLNSLSNILKNSMAIGPGKPALIQQPILSMPTKSSSSFSLPRLNNVPRADSSNSSNSATAKIKRSDSITQQTGSADFLLQSGISKGAINITSSTPSAPSSTIGSELSDSEMSMPDSDYFASFGLVASDDSEHSGNSPKQDLTGSNESGHPYTFLTKT